LFQHRHFTAGNGHQRVRDPYLARSDIEGYIARGQDHTQRGARTAKECPDPGQDFFHCECLGQVIIGTAIETAHSVFQRIARGQDQHWDRFAPITPRFQQIYAVAIGQSEVENDRIIFGCGNCRIGFVGKFEGVDREVGLLETFANRVPQLLIVFGK
jgi:hypothetical protein